MRACVLLLLVSPVVSAAADRVYPAVGADGRIQLIHSDASPDDKVKPDAEAKKSPEAKSINPKEGESQGKEPEAGNKRSITESGETYQTSEVLEREGYRPDGKNRFYYIPDGNGHMTIESNAGIPVWSSPSGSESRSDTPEQVKASPNYMVLEASRLGNVLSGLDRCLNAKLLKKARKISEIRRLSVEAPLSDADQLQPDYLFSVGDLHDFAVRAVSYATAITKPGYYVPLPVWFDSKGCPLAGVWNYWTTDFPGTDFRFSSIESVMISPSNVAYLGFYNPPSSGLPRPPFPLQRFGVMTLDIFE